MKDNLKKFGGWIVACILLILATSLYFEKQASLKLIKNYKSELIESDSLRKISDTKYQKLVDDRLTNKELISYLKSTNKELYDIIKSENKKPISYTIIQAQPETKTETIPINKEERDGQIFTTFYDYYPNKINPFIKYSGEIYTDSIKGKFDFNSLDIGIVISEKQKGLFEADLDAPEWLNVKKLEVKSLPLEKVDTKNFSLLAGGSTGLSLTTYRPVFEGKFGFSTKKSIWIVEGNTNSEVKIGLLKKF